jgi:hypothetical protein
MFVIGGGEGRMFFFFFFFFFSLSDILSYSCILVQGVCKGQAGELASRSNGHATQRRPLDLEPFFRQVIYIPLPVANPGQRTPGINRYGTAFAHSSQSFPNSLFRIASSTGILRGITTRLIKMMANITEAMSNQESLI